MFRNVALKNISISLQNIYRFLSKLIVLRAFKKGLIFVSLSTCHKVLLFCAGNIKPRFVTSYLVTN